MDAPGDSKVHLFLHEDGFCSLSEFLPVGSKSARSCPLLPTSLFSLGSSAIQEVELLLVFTQDFLGAPQSATKSMSASRSSYL